MRGSSATSQGAWGDYAVKKLEVRRLPASADPRLVLAVARSRAS